MYRDQLSLVSPSLLILVMSHRYSFHIFSSPDPSITVSIASSVSTPMVGSMYSLNCTVTGAERLIDAGAMVTYRWLKNGAVISGQTMATLSFSSLTFSDAGSYTCQATVTSSLLSVPITTPMSNSESVHLTCRFSLMSFFN